MGSGTYPARLGSNADRMQCYQIKSTWSKLEWSTNICGQSTSHFFFFLLLLWNAIIRANPYRFRDQGRFLRTKPCLTSLTGIVLVLVKAHMITLKVIFLIVHSKLSIISALLFSSYSNGCIAFITSLFSAFKGYLSVCVTSSEWGSSAFRD